MATKKQKLGAMGESLVVRNCNCPKCKRSGTFKLLPPNFKCADIICDFCGFLAQVKTNSVKDALQLPRTVLGAAWKPQKERMDSGIYFPLFLVLCSDTSHAIYYLPIDFQSPELFEVRKPLGPGARRAGWQGFNYNLDAIPRGGVIMLFHFESCSD